VRKIKDSLDPASLDVDLATDTVYAANAGPMGNGAGDTVSVIDGAKCNGSVSSGCGARARIVKVGSNPQWVAVDQATNTVYVANYNDGTVSVINGARCNGTVGAGCGHTPPTVGTGAGQAYIGIDKPAHTAFVMNGGDDTLSAIDTSRCTGAHPAGCGALARAQQAGANQDPGFAQYPSQFALIAGTGTAYAVNVGGSDVLAILDVSGCTATHTSTCRHPAPSVPEHEFLATLDPSTNTIYASDLYRSQIDLIDAATCRAGDLRGCTPVATIPGLAAQVGAIDVAHHTLYAADPPAGTVALINTGTCNVSQTAGCATKPATFKLGPYPNPPALNSVTQSLYTVVGRNSNQVAVINAATCNAQVMSGCGQPIGIVPVGVATIQLAVSPATDTIYAPSFGQNGSGHTVDVINGASCNATEHAGCGTVAAKITAGRAPFGAAVDEGTHTLYVSNNAEGDHPGSATIVNTNTCNGTQTSGCTGSHPAIPIGRAGLLVAIDPTTNKIYITTNGSATVSIINGARCDAVVTTGCARPAAAQPVGSEPFGILVNPATDTVYALTDLGAGAMSIFAGAR
jgi:DNA-binding beta-propeller fold protein YncE